MLNSHKYTHHAIQNERSRGKIKGRNNMREKKDENIMNIKILCDLNMKWDEKNTEYKMKWDLKS